jgi:hypothetical protein
MNDVIVRFTITPDVRAEVDALRRTRRMPLFWFICIAALSTANAVEIVKTSLRLHAAHGNAAESAVLLFSAIPIVGTMIFGVWYSLRIRRLPVSGELTMSDTGIAGVLDGRDVRLPWKNVTSVERTKHAFVIALRNMNAIVVPLASVTDPDALWAFFDERLVSRRGLIRSSQMATIINNTALTRIS